MSEHRSRVDVAVGRLGLALGGEVEVELLRPPAADGAITVVDGVLTDAVVTADARVEVLVVEHGGGRRLTSRVPWHAVARITTRRTPGHPAL